MNNEKDYHPSNEDKTDSWFEGYDSGYWGYRYENPYVELSPLWVEYDLGYDTGVNQRLEDDEF